LIVLNDSLAWCPEEALITENKSSIPYLVSYAGLNEEEK